MTETATCRQCAYWEGEPVDTLSDEEERCCKRRPPQLINIGGLAAPRWVSAWPATRASEWCGDGKLRTVGVELSRAITKARVDNPSPRKEPGQ